MGLIDVFFDKVDDVLEWLWGHPDDEMQGGQASKPECRAIAKSKAETGCPCSKTTEEEIQSLSKEVGSSPFPPRDEQPDTDSSL